MARRLPDMEEQLSKRDQQQTPANTNTNTNPFAPTVDATLPAQPLNPTPTPTSSKSPNKNENKGFEYETLGNNHNENLRKKKYTTTVEREKKIRDEKGRVLNKRKRSNIIEIFTEEVLNKFTKGNLDKQQTIFELGYNRVFADRHTKMVFQIVEFPIEGLDVGFLDNIRESLKNRFPAKDQNKVDVIFINNIKDNYIDLNSRKLRNLEGTLESQKQYLLDEKEIMLNPFLGVDPLMLEESQSDPRLAGSISAKKANRSQIYEIDQRIKFVERKQKTFDVVENYQRDGGHIVDLFLFIELIVKDETLLKDAANRLESILSGYKLKYRTITDLDGYLSHFGIASLQDIAKRDKFDALPFIITSNVPACGTNFQPGIIRSKSAEIWLGNQLGNNYRFDIAVTDSGAAENYLIIAKSGSGKSVMMAFAMLTAMNNPYMNVIIKDYKGEEWSKFAGIFGDKADVIAMNADDAVFVNTFKISDHNLFGFVSPQASYQLSFGISIKILTALVDTTPEKRKIVQDICTDIVNKVYLIKGVFFDAPSTYINSQNIHFRDDTWLALNELFQSTDILGRYEKEDLSLVRRALEVYLAPNAPKRAFFEKEADLHKILFNNRVLVFDYGTETVGGNQSQTENEVKTRILQESFCESLFCALNKKKNEFTIVVTEELQKQLDDDLLLSELNNSFTVGRSFNKINFGVTNTIGPILASNNKHIMAIKENLTGYIIGKVDPAVIRDLVDYTDIKTIQYSLQDVGKGEGIYKNAFLFYSLSHKVDTVIVKMPLTEAMISTVIPSKTKLTSDLDYTY